MDKSETPEQHYDIDKRRVMLIEKSNLFSYLESGWLEELTECSIQPRKQDMTEAEILIWRQKMDFLLGKLEEAYKRKIALRDEISVLLRDVVRFGGFFDIDGEK